MKTTARSTPALQLIQVRKGIKPTIIIINGFLSKNGEDVSDWLEVINELYPTNQVLYARWDAGDLADIAKGKGLVEGQSKLLSQVVGKSSLVKALATTAIVANKVSGHWKDAFHETNKVGIELAVALEEDKTLHGSILMGHSLGARVIWHTLAELNEPVVNVVYLLAGAVSSNQSEWAEIFINHPDTKFVNCMSQNDSVLKNAYKLGCLFNHQPAGLTPLCEALNPNLFNFDVTALTKGHTDFKTKAIGKLLKKELDNRKLLSSEACEKHSTYING